MQEVILVNQSDKVLGKMEKLEAHKKGRLHRAFSIFIFNDKGELLLQQRAVKKYHSGGLWTNTCCSHPAPGEDTLVSAENRLLLEMGFRVNLNFFSSFLYKTTFVNGLMEHEFDHVFIGKYNGYVHINEEEVMDYKWVSPAELEKTVKSKPQDFTVWFLKIYKEVVVKYQPL